MNGRFLTADAINTVEGRHHNFDGGDFGHGLTESEMQMSRQRWREICIRVGRV